MSFLSAVRAISIISDTEELNLLMYDRLEIKLWQEMVW